MITAQSRLGDVTAQSRRGHSSVTARSQLSHGEVTAQSRHLQYDHGSVTARSQLNHGPGHGSVTAGCDHFSHRELTVSSHGGQFFSHVQCYVWQFRLAWSGCPWITSCIIAWWRHQMETFSVLLDLCVGTSPVTGEFPAKRPMTQSSDVFSDLRLEKWLNEEPWGWWFETPSRSLWRHCNGVVYDFRKYGINWNARVCGHWHGSLIISIAWDIKAFRITSSL